MIWIVLVDDEQLDIDNENQIDNAVASKPIIP